MTRNLYSSKNWQHLCFERKNSFGVEIGKKRGPGKSMLGKNTSTDRYSVPFFPCRFVDTKDHQSMDSHAVYFLQSLFFSYLNPERDFSLRPVISPKPSWQSRLTENVRNSLFIFIRRSFAIFRTAFCRSISVILPLAFFSYNFGGLTIVYKLCLNVF